MVWLSLVVWLAWVCLGCYDVVVWLGWLLLLFVVFFVVVWLCVWGWLHMWRGVVCGADAVGCFGCFVFI